MSVLSKITKFKKEPASTEAKSSGKKTVKKTAKRAVKKTERKSDIPGILIQPILTEKSTVLAEKNQYTFKVVRSANKKEIEKAVERNYKVNVVSVKIISVPRKKRKLGRTPGWRKGFKKAIVRIEKGQKIELNTA